MHRHRFLAAVGCAALAFVSLSGQSPATGAPEGAASAQESGWKAPRTPHGQPDIQGVWDFANLTPLERPARFVGKETFTEAEAAQFERQIVEEYDFDRSRAPGAPEERPEHFSPLWRDWGSRVRTLRTSLITRPSNGRLPPLTPESKKNASAFEQRMRRPPESHEDRSLSERCIVGFNNGAPILPSGYNNNLQIFQTPDHVVIHLENIHDARIVLLKSAPHLPSSVRLWLGDSRGRWDGETLVIETTNFVDTEGVSISGPARGASARMHLAERFTRTDADTLTYEFTVTDPAMYAEPWGAIVPMKRSESRIYEYACHEGNHYGMLLMLAGARAEEKNAGAAGIGR